MAEREARPALATASIAVGRRCVTGHSEVQRRATLRSASACDVEPSARRPCQPAGWPCAQATRVGTRAAGGQATPSAGVYPRGSAAGHPDDEARHRAAGPRWKEMSRPCPEGDRKTQATREGVVVDGKGRARLEPSGQVEIRSFHARCYPVGERRNESRRGRRVPLAQAYPSVRQAFPRAATNVEGRIEFEDLCHPPRVPECSPPLQLR